MKKLIILSLLLSYLSGFAQQKFDLSTSESQVFWKGSHAFEHGGYEGTLKFTSGNITLGKDGKIQGGSFVIEMKTIKSAERNAKEKGDNNLESHLKGEDFFAVQKYPQATFIITKINKTAEPNKYAVQGNLKIRGITNQITFTAFIDNNKESITAKASFFFLRSSFGITYKAPSLFASNIFSSAKDHLIADEIPIKLDIVFKK
ncbi:YceI family protein [Arcicella rosea]|uniref:Polyisoprenoid-binding protein YceI n=1 Tax=Arcicella rosea TaxID=502909 RepID=A0A841ERF7_9BACT|nr:YceI family protein [Arcicella rosea]MBB6002840.1 polyisoprenoid-binding protein YceI [Arcicella rosea]